MKNWVAEGIASDVNDFTLHRYYLNDLSVQYVMICTINVHNDIVHDLHVLYTPE